MFLCVNKLSLGRINENIPCRIGISKILLYGSFDFRKLGLYQGVSTEYIRSDALCVCLYIYLRVRVLQKCRHNKYLETNGKYQNFLEKETSITY